MAAPLVKPPRLKPPSGTLVTYLLAISSMYIYIYSLHTYMLHIYIYTVHTLQKTNIAMENASSSKMNSDKNIKISGVIRLLAYQRLCIHYTLVCWCIHISYIIYIYIYVITYYLHIIYIYIYIRSY